MRDEIIMLKLISKDEKNSMRDEIIMNQQQT
jgi:hypothetical protein